MGRTLRLAAIPGALVAGITCLPLLAARGTPATLPAPGGGSVAGIPPRVLAAYQAANGWCPGLRWQLLAGIGWVESRHGTAGGATVDDATGVVAPLVLGPPLDGIRGERHPAGPWQGRWGITGPWEQAVGPMQFRPGTFAAWAVDGDQDGETNPHDVDDAVPTAANYLCGGTAGRIADERAALRRYNNSDSYGDAVLAYADSLMAFGLSPGWLCPVAGPTTFTDTWLAPRSGGRLHKGVDMFAAPGTPVIAPVGGVVEHFDEDLGGLSFRLWGDDGNYYFGTHLSAFGRVTGHVEAGTIVGYVGDTGNARGTGAHLHFEIHLGRRQGDMPAPVNPTPTVAAHCSAPRA